MPLRQMTVFGAAVLLAGLLLAAPPVLANDDAYTREIRAEGEKTERLDRAREEIRRSEEQERARENKDNKTAGPAPAGKTQEDFEKLLRKDSPASYRFYADFTPERRSGIFKLYLKEKKMSVVKRKIVDTYLGI